MNGKSLSRLLSAGLIVVPTLVAAQADPGIAGVPSAQTPASPAFEVASVKQNKSSGNTRPQFSIQPGGRVTVSNMPLDALIRMAYQLQPLQLLGGPSLTGSDRFDIVAKSATEIRLVPGTIGPLQHMLQSLLVDRFNLKVHTEARELPVYVMAIERTDGRLGPQLHPSSLDCADATAGAQPPGGQRRCGMNATPGYFSGGGVALSQLALGLSAILQRVVIDRTGLAGTFDFDLTWTPDSFVLGPPHAAAAFPLPDPNAPAMLTALREQLGLKINSPKEPVDVLVIDHVEHPSED